MDRGDLMVECRWSSRSNLREYCAGCAYGTRLGCELSFSQVPKKQHPIVIPAGETSIKVGRYTVYKTGRQAVAVAAASGE